MSDKVYNRIVKMRNDFRRYAKWRIVRNRQSLHEKQVLMNEALSLDNWKRRLITANI